MRIQVSKGWLDVGENMNWCTQDIVLERGTDLHIKQWRRLLYNHTL